MKHLKAYQRGSRILIAALTVLGSAPLVLQVAVPAAHAQSQPQPPVKLSNPQLDALTAPIALYPDALLAQVLMAATFPQDIPAAEAWSQANPNLKGDDAVKAVSAAPWDPSVQSLVAFPQVLATMASKPDWVAQLGDAFLAQPNDVMDSVQRLRKQAHQAGNLQSNPQQKIVVEQSTIQIVPVNPQVVYVPTYNPTVVYGTWAYPAYPPVYVPPPPGYAVASGLAAGLAFGVGVAITSSLWSDVNWNNHSVDINVNKYNNINVNRRLDVNSSTTNWNRNSTFNRNTTTNVNSVQRDDYRGRDTSASRAQAQQTLQNRTGQNLGGTASQRVQGIQQGGNTAGNGRGSSANAANTQRDAYRGRDTATSAPQAQQSQQNRTGQNRGSTSGQRPQGNQQNGNNTVNIRNSAQNVNRDNALRGAGNGGDTQRDMQRGQASRQSLANNNGNGQQRRSASGAGRAEQPRNGAGGGGQRHFGR